MDKFSTHDCIPYFIKWDTCVKKKDSEKCKDVFDGWVECHKKRRDIKKSLAFAYSDKSMDGPYGGFS